MKRIAVKLGSRSYEIVLTRAESAGPGRFVRTTVPRASTALVIADDNVQKNAMVVADSIRGVGLNVESASVPAGEASKSLAQASSLYDRLADLGADRQTVVVAVGGGVIGDLAGFVAATYNRGLPLVMVPTTLLAMVDSAVGGKVAVNHAKGKNLIGAFHQPAGVWIDTDALTTLPDREYRSGIAEVVKYGASLDADFFRVLEQEIVGLLARAPELLDSIITRCCELKRDIVEQDEREELGLRAVLNYGHTFAHAFETVGGYGTWLHGEAVAAGMVCASRLAERLGRIPGSVTHKQASLLSALGLPVAPLPEWASEDLIEVMRRDKKALAGKLHFVLPSRLGHVELVEDVPEVLVREVLRP